MNKKLQNQLQRYGLYVFYGLLVYMPLHVLLSTWLGTAFGFLEVARVAKDIVLVVGFSIALGVSLGKPWFKQILVDKLVWLTVAYGLLTFAMALLKPTDQQAEILGVVYNTRFLVFFLYGMFLANLYKPQDIVKRAMKFVLISALVVLSFGVIQYVILPDDALTHIGYSKENGVLPAFFIDNKPDLERIMSTVRDPNSLGSYIIIIGLLALAIRQKAKSQHTKTIANGFMILSLVCLWFSFSRSAWLGFALAIGIFLALHPTSRRKATKISPNILVIAIVVATTGLMSVYSFKDSYFIQNVVFHADESTTLEDPNELRLRFWQESLKGVIDNPIGNGPGTAGIVSIRNQQQGTILNENYYLQIAHEVGIVGLIIFAAILIIVALRLYGLSSTNLFALALLASFAGLALTNFLVHIWSNEAVSYTWWGLAGLVLVSRSSTKELK